MRNRTDGGVRGRRRKSPPTRSKRTRKVFYWEHLGMLDDAEYAEKAIKRVQSMEASGILSGKNLLITAETKQNPISIKSVNILIQEYLI